MTSIRQYLSDLRDHLSDLLFDASKRLSPLEPIRYGVRIVWDELYQPELAGNDDESRMWLAKEQADLDDGATIALGMIVVKECPCCGNVDEAPEGDSLWGIVVDWPEGFATSDELDTFEPEKLPDAHLREVAADLLSQVVAR